MTSYCFFSDTLPLFPTDREKEVFEIALIYQIEKVINEGIYTFNSCMLPGIDLICTSFIAGIINRYNNLENKKNIHPHECANLRLRIYKKPYPTRAARCLSEEMQHIIQAASFVHHWSTADEDRCIKRAIKASTHMFAVYPNIKPRYVLFAEKNGLEIHSFTPNELISDYLYPNETQSIFL